MELHEKKIMKEAFGRYHHVYRVSRVGKLLSDSKKLLGFNFQKKKKNKKIYTYKNIRLCNTLGVIKNLQS